VWVLPSRAPGIDPVAASPALRRSGEVIAASPYYRFGLFFTQPSDVYLSYQWYVDDPNGANIHLPDAWDTARGDTSVTIAIIDTGVDTGHPDLASKIWHNRGEIPGNGIDDDGNGYVDDWQGWDFGVGDNDPNPEYTSDPSGLDVGFHGTFCAGIAAAATNNGDGIAGAGWNCRIMPLKVAHPDSGITSEAIAGAFAYAVDQHASVISMSFGGPGDPGVPEFFQALVDMAVFGGAVCVAAAGNDGSSVKTYPAACDRVLAVAATDGANLRADFSNWGSWVDVAAPGASMWSSICRNYTFTDLDQLFYEFLFNWDSFNPYMYGDGTSFACPLTAGVCGLVRARFPSLTPELVMRQIVATGDAIAYDHPIGPKVNAQRAVTQAPTAVAVDGAAPGLPRVVAVPNPLQGAGEIRFALPAAGRARLALYDASGRRVRTLVDGPLSAGSRGIAWDGTDDRGARVAAGVYFAQLTAEGSEVRSKVVLVRP
jgi:subtilisin family serine protease